MKKVIFTLVALAMTLTMSAQQQRREFNPEQMAERTAKSIQEAVGLSDAQYTQVYELMLKQNKEWRAQRDSLQKAGVDARQGFNREAMQKRQQAQQEALKAILTPEQQAKYEKYQQERMQRRGQGGQRGGQGGPRGQRGQN